MDPLDATDHIYRMDNVDRPSGDSELGRLRAEVERLTTLWTVERQEVERLTGLLKDKWGGAEQRAHIDEYYSKRSKRLGE